MQFIQTIMLHIVSDRKPGPT